MTRRVAFREQAWPEDPVFKTLAADWSEGAATQILDWVWRAFDALRSGPIVNADLTKPLEQLERDLTDLHFGQIQLLWALETGGRSTFYPDHEIPEYESRQPAPAQPPEYDLGFVLYANPRIIWPIEAKLMRRALTLTGYLSDVRGKFIAGIAAPFVGQAGMIGYLLSGAPSEMLTKLENELAQTLRHHVRFATREHWTSFHTRSTSSFGRDLPDLLLHHLVMKCF